MWTRDLLKTNAKQRLSRYHWYGVLVCWLASLLGAHSASASLSFDFSFLFDSGSSNVGDYMDPSYDAFPEYGIGESITFLVVALVVATIILILVAAYAALVANPVRIGFARYFLSAREVKTPVSELFSGFRRNYANSILVMFMRDLYVFLWYFLFIIPGIIKSYSYFMVPYLLAENPDMDYHRALELSSEMMVGHKMECFVLQLSFIGWYLLSAFTANILGILYVNPYETATLAEFYVAVRSEAFAKGLTSPMELPFQFT
jgi:hypothetical protein